MGTGKKEAARKERQGKGDDGMANVKTKGENFYRYVQPQPDTQTALTSQY
jgi:predicted NAD/FAD-dependent oxidoreductase